VVYGIDMLNVHLISTATASHHATALRSAGLIMTQRLGSAVLHTLAPLGTQLLNGRLDLD